MTDYSADSSVRVHNPLLAKWSEPYELPPFRLVQAEHFLSAFNMALAEHLAEIEAISTQTEVPDFFNTLVRFDQSGRSFQRISQLFYNLTASETSAELQTVERQMAPRLANHSSAIYMHAGLFKRIDQLYIQRKQLGLDTEQLRLLERVHLDFIRAGAKLSAEKKIRYAQITEELAALTTQFSQNLLAEEARWHLLLQAEEELAGLPIFVQDAARTAAQERGIAQGWIITLSRSLIVPFLSFSSRRDLREKAFVAWTQRGQTPGAHDNRPIIKKILLLRNEQAKLHGYACYADYALVDTMAGTQSAVKDLLLKVWEPAKVCAKQEYEALSAQAVSCGQAAPIAPWDWRYYAEQVRQARYALDDAAIKPYFALDRMIEAMFDCAHRLFGLRFVEQPHIKTYHPDVRVFEVQRADGSLQGLFLSDNFARSSKQGGAWMSNYRLQSKIGGGVTPIVVNNNNFSKAPPGKPTLLSIDDVRTLFHEFGHGLHGLLSNVRYEQLSGTQVLRDFVELPSQLFEHWFLEPSVLRQHARHVTTDEPIPDALVARIKAARRFNQGFESVEYTASALLDLALHAQTDVLNVDIDAFEKTELEKIGMPQAIVMRHRLPHFGHLFSSSSYASQYYVYLWAEVLDADGFEAFVEAGDPFDTSVAERLYKFIYSSGNCLEPGEAYRAFRGRDPSVKPMLRKKGLLAEAEH